MGSFDSDFSWQRRFIPEMKRIVGEHLIGEAPDEEDMQRNTDLVVLKLDAVRIACRVRRNQYLQNYADEFTIRTSRPSEIRTELSKIIEGWGDYILYGFSNPTEDALTSWCLGSLGVFRLWFNRELWKGEHPGIEQQNRDGSSQFRAFNIDDLPEEFVVARKLQQTLEPATRDTLF